MAVVEVLELEEDDILRLGRCLGEIVWNVVGWTQEVLEFDRIVALWERSLEQRENEAK